MDRIHRIARLLNEWDPLKLVDDLDDDEYIPEAKQIAQSLDSVESPDRLAEIVQNVLMEYFGESVPLDECLQFSRKIWGW